MARKAFYCSAREKGGEEAEEHERLYLRSKSHEARGAGIGEAAPVLPLARSCLRNVSHGCNHGQHRRMSWCTLSRGARPMEVATSCGLVLE